MQIIASENTPIGVIIQIGENTPSERLNASFFNKYLFQYFEELSCGQTGWGLNFLSWLEITHGWRQLGWHRYERIQKTEE